MPVLVTGGAGFVGASVCKHLARLGEKVVALDATPDGSLLDLVLTAEQRSRVQLEIGDMTDLAHLLRIFRRHHIDQVIHLAYLSTMPTRANPARAQKINIEGTNNVFEAVLDRGITRFVWASTIDVFGPKSAASDGVVANDAPYDPQNAYAAAKVLNEVAAQDYARDFGLRYIALRIPAAFGPGVTKSWVRFVPQMIKDLVEGNPCQAPKIKKVMPWLYVEDIADVFARGLNFTGEPGVRGYTLPGSEMGTDQIVRLIRDMFPGKSIDYIDWPDFGTVPSYDCAPLGRLMGWSPHYGIEKGLSRIADYYKGALNGSGPPN